MENIFERTKFVAEQNFGSINFFKQMKYILLGGSHVGTLWTLSIHCGLWWLEKMPVTCK